MKREAFILVICLRILGAANAQEDTYNQVDLHPVSPAAFQFAKYTEMPVSEYTGIPNISIPLYEVNVDGLKIPVDLTYHSRGINVTQEASWVGLGWDLQMGSLIQTINDQDDYGISTLNPIVKQLPDYFPSNGDGSPFPLPLFQLDPNAGLHGMGWMNPYPINQPMAQQGYAIATSYYIPVQGQFSVQQQGLFTQRWYDSEPDFFVASFPEGTVKFILDFNNPGRIVVLNKLGYKVVKTSAGFEITAPTGNNYYFETVSTILNNTQATDLQGSTSPFLTAGDTVSRIFFLSRIITKNNKQVTFQYATTSQFNDYPTRSQKMQVLTDLGPQSMPAPPGQGIYSFNNNGLIASPPWMGPGTQNTNSYNIERNFYLQAIVFPTGRLDFFLSSRQDINGGEKLDSVRITNSSGTPIKTWQVDYTYFNSSGVGGNGYGDETGGTLSLSPFSNLRLELMDVRERGQGGQVYSFSYNPTLLPKKNSYAVDYWGFYNGALSNTSFIPNPTAVNLPSFGDNGNNKSANVSYAQAGILQGIQYPTGGKVAFEFELNQLNTNQMLGVTPINSVISGGGLRIHAVSHLNSDGSQATRKVYTYGTGRQINFTPMIQQTPFLLLNTVSLFGDEMITEDYTLTQISVNGVFSSSPMASLSGVGYDTVTVQDVDANNNSIGSTVTTYYNKEDVHNPTIYSRIKNANIPAVRSISDPENGSIATVTKYDKHNTMVEDTRNAYELSPSPIYYGARILPYGDLYFQVEEAEDDWVLRSMPQNIVGYFPIYDVQTLLQDTYDTLFYVDGFMPRQTSYIYDIFNQISEVTKDRSGGGIDNLNYVYPYNTTSPSPIFQTMVANNRLADIVTFQRRKNFSTVQYQYDKSFQQAGSLILESKVVIQNNPIPNGPQNFPDSITYDIYDPSNANLLQYTAKGITNAVIWDYNKNYTVAMVKNATSSQVAYTSFEADGTGNWTFTGVATADTTCPTGTLCYKLDQPNGSIGSPALNSAATYIVSYWVKGSSPLGITGTVAGSPIRGKTIRGWTYFEHKVTGQTALTISGSGFIDELRLYPSTAQMTTYTYIPLVGETSECDIDNRVTYYEYDGFGRLKDIRDQDGNVIKTVDYHYQGQ